MASPRDVLADEVCRRIEGARCFQWLLTRFTTPEELFGAVSLKGFAEDDYRRLTTHKLPEAHVAFLDEIFKASSSIPNTILTLVTSSADTPLFVRDLNPRERHAVQEDRALDVAEYFPGGGTDFETPLSAALDGLRVARYRRGDVVLNTDGECRVTPDWLARFKAETARLGLSVHSVLIDVGASSQATLTVGGVRDLFLRP